MKGNIMKHCFKLTSNKFMVVLTLVLGLYLGKTDAIYRFTLNWMTTSGKAPPRVSTILHPCTFLYLLLPKHRHHNSNRPSSPLLAYPCHVLHRAGLGAGIGRSADPPSRFVGRSWNAQKKRQIPFDSWWCADSKNVFFIKIGRWPF